MEKVNAEFTGLFDDDGTEVWVTPTGETKTEVSPPVYTPPGKNEAHTFGRFSFEIAAATLVKDTWVDVWNDGEGSHYKINLPTYICQTYVDGPWFRLHYRHEYIGHKRVFTCTMENWSHTWGRVMQLHLTYEIANRVSPPKNRIADEKS